MKIQAPRGTKDVLPQESRRWQELESTLREAAAGFGFREVRFPAFEHTELFLRGIGDATDVVQKEMYTFEDKGGRSVTLRPEGTASVVRLIVEHGLYAGAMPLKCYYIAPNFRYEKPAAGRLRQHHQFGAECFGASSPDADAEMIGLADLFIKKLKLPDVTLCINSIGCPKCRPEYHKALKGFFASVKEKLCPTCHERLDRNPMRILDCKNPDCISAAEKAPVMLDFLCPECDGHFSGVKSGLENLGIEFSVDTHIVRGLDYYTKTVFEFLVPIEGVPRAICAGGRYDGLVKQLGGPELPGLGFGSGLERLLLAMENRPEQSDDRASGELYIAALGEEAQRRAARLCMELRELGTVCQTDICGRGLKAQMKYADKLGVAWVVVIGDDELGKGEVTLKNMLGGEDKVCTLNAGEIYALLERNGQK